jgi:Leucine-rich repeat (LRR) protein
MNKIILVLVLAITGLGIMSSCSEKVQRETVEFSFESNTVSFGATAKKIVVDWGDGTTEEYTDIIVDYNRISHTYPNSAIRTVKIQAEELISLSCYSNQLTSLSCNENNLTSLDVSACTKLTELQCFGNQLTSLDVSVCTKLTRLYCYWNQLTSLDVSACTKLTQLYCGRNRLTSLDVSACTELTELSCDNNQLTATDLNTVFTDLPNRSSETAGEIYIDDNPGSSTCNRSIVTNKN